MIGRVAEHAGEVGTRILQKGRRRQFISAGASSQFLKSFKNTGFQAGMLQVVGYNGCVMPASDHDGVKAHIGHNYCSFHRKIFQLILIRRSGEVHIETAPSHV
jgi:hypothetical protein